MLENNNKQGDRKSYTRKILKIYNIPPKQYDHVERMQNKRMPKQIATAIVEQTKKRGRPRKIWRHEVEEGLSIMGIKHDGQWPETVGSRGR